MEIEQILSVASQVMQRVLLFLQTPQALYLFGGIGLIQTAYLLIQLFTQWPGRYGFMACMRHLAVCLFFAGAGLAQVYTSLKALSAFAG